MLFEDEKEAVKLGYTVGGREY